MGMLIVGETMQIPDFAHVWGQGCGGTLCAFPSIFLWT